MEWVTHFQSWIALGTLTALEIVLGIDNIIFISVLVGRLPHERRDRARVLGLALAMVSRILLLLSLTWVMTLRNPLFTIASRAFTGRDLILASGGLFLLAKSTREIHHSLMGETEHPKAKAASRMAAVLVQIAVLDIVFSLDSVITAIGLASGLRHPISGLDHVLAMIAVGLWGAQLGSDQRQSRPGNPNPAEQRAPDPNGPEAQFLSNQKCRTGLRANQDMHHHRCGGLSHFTVAGRPARGCWAGRRPRCRVPPGRR